MNKTLHNNPTVLGHDPSRMARAAVLAIGGIKGGIGKTTSAIFLALAYHRLGVKVLVIDADPGSGSARRWNRRARMNGEPLPFEVVSHPAEDLEERIVDEGWHEQHQLLIIDTGGDSDKILKSAYKIADFLLLTASPSPADLDTMDATARATVGELGDRGIPEYLLITASKSARMVKNAKRDLREAGINVLTNTIGHFVEFQDAYGWTPGSDLGYEAVRYEIEELKA